jgi:PRC-barrel domain
LAALIIPFPKYGELDTRFSLDSDQFAACTFAVRRLHPPLTSNQNRHIAPSSPPGEQLHMRSTLTMLAGVLCASLALAQDTTTTTTTTVQYQRVSTVVGGTVVLGTETIGKVTEIVINSDGCIEYLVVQYGEAFVPIPWTVTTVNFERRVFTITSTDVTVARLKELTFTQDRWPNFADRTFTERVTTVWGSAATRSGAGAKGGGAATKTAPKTDSTGRPKTDVDPTKKDPTKTEPPRKEPDKKDPTRTEPPKKEPDKKDPKDKKDPDKDKDG